MSKRERESKINLASIYFKVNLVEFLCIRIGDKIRKYNNNNNRVE